MKKYSIIIALSLIIIFNCSKVYTNTSKRELIKSNVAILNKMENRDISKIEKEIEKVQRKFQVSQELTLNYKDIFKNSVFLGDSQTEGLKVYNILNSNSVLAKKGSNLVDARGSLSTLSNLNPSTIFLLYGMNDILIYRDNIGNFIDDYSYLIKEIKQILPNTKIVVNAILPVTESVIQKRSIYKKISEYNEQLSIICKSLEVEFVDSSYLLKENQSLFEGDGMHLKPNFYLKWLNLLRTEVNL